MNNQKHMNECDDNTSASFNQGVLWLESGESFSCTIAQAKAAPDLLEALETARDEIKEMLQDFTDAEGEPDISAERTLAQIDAAIAKAYGPTNQ